MKKLLPWLTAALVATGCSSQKVCSTDQVLCGSSCVSLQSDPSNCGACGNACGAGQGCSLGACVACGPGGEGCKAEVLAACFNAAQVRAFDTSLAAVGAPVTTAAGPASFSALGGAIYVTDNTGGAVEQVTPPKATAVASVTGASYNDLEHLGAYGGLLYVSNAAVGSFVAIDPVARKVVDEVSLASGGSAPSIQGFDFANRKAYLALTPPVGTTTPNALAIVDLSASPPWTTLPSIKLVDLSGFATGAALPGAARVLASPDGRRVFVTLNDLYDPAFNVVPGANGKLLVVDTATDTVIGGAAIDLGAGCTNPSGMALSGTTLWIGCGHVDFATGLGVGGALLAVDVSGATPVPGTPVPLPQAIGSLAMCGGRGYAGATDRGALVAFDPATGAVLSTNEAACPAGTGGYSAVFDVACAL